jgi:uncharacterized cupredoxin-like copper-binding protein
MRMTIVALAMLVAACAGSDKTTVDSAGGEVDGAAVQGTFIIGLAEWKVDSPMDTLPAGRYTFRVENSGTEKHALEIEGNGREWETGDLEPGNASELTVDLEPGTYELYCPRETHDREHEEQGMKRKLVVRAS